MSFSRTTRALTSDRPRRSMIGLVLSMVVLALWAGWLFLARVAVYEVSESARLETATVAYPVAAEISHPVVGVYMALGQEVKAGDVLVELNGEDEEHLLHAERRRLAALQRQLAATRQELSAAEGTGAETQQRVRGVLDELNQRYSEGVANGTLSPTDRFALRQDILRTELEAGSAAHDHQTRLDHLKDLRAELQDKIAVLESDIDQIEHQLEHHAIRAPADGRLAEVADVQVGSVVQTGERLATIVPDDELKIVAAFAPRSALGRIQPGQPAQLRLDGFPWTQYGTIPATVTSVGSEVRDGRVQVELTALNAPDWLRLQHAMPGSVQVQVEHVAPAALVLRSIGMLVDHSPVQEASR